jgi:hypothetical protein
MQRKVSDSPSKLILGTAVASFAALGVVVIAATLSPPVQYTCTAAPTHEVGTAMEPVEKIPSYQVGEPPPPPPRPLIRDPRPMPPPAK